MLLITNFTHFFNVFVYFISLHVSSNPVLIIRRIELNQYIRWYISLCVDDCLVCRSGRTGIPDSHLHRVIYTRWCIDSIRFSWWWTLGCSKHVEKWNKYIHWKKCFRLVINKNYTEMHGQRNIKFWIISSTNFNAQFSLFVNDMQSALNQCTVQTFTESEDTRCCVNTIFLLKIGMLMLETCRG